MQAEGGYSNNPADTGGETFKGVSRKNNPNWSGWVIIDAIKATNPPSLNVALNQNGDLLQNIMSFYQVNYWDVIRTGDINDQQTANQVFDTAVNCGTGTAARFLQQAAGVTADRIIGSVSIAAVNAANSQNLYDQFLSYRKQYYLDIITRSPSQAQFEHSWFARLWPYQETAQNSA
jgi:lysozyme family protein